jgi:hypothetical protein
MPALIMFRLMAKFCLRITTNFTFSLSQRNTPLSSLLAGHNCPAALVSANSVQGWILNFCNFTLLLFFRFLLIAF